MLLTWMMQPHIRRRLPACREPGAAGCRTLSRDLRLSAGERTREEEEGPPLPNGTTPPLLHIWIICRSIPLKAGEYRAWYCICMQADFDRLCNAEHTMEKCCCFSQGNLPGVTALVYLYEPQALTACENGTNMDRQANSARLNHSEAVIGNWLWLWQNRPPANALYLFWNWYNALQRTSFSKAVAGGLSQSMYIYWMGHVIDGCCCQALSRTTWAGKVVEHNRLYYRVKNGFGLTEVNTTVWERYLKYSSLTDNQTHTQNTRGQRRLQRTTANNTETTERNALPSRKWAAKSSKAKSVPCAMPTHSHSLHLSKDFHYFHRS